MKDRGPAEASVVERPLTVSSASGLCVLVPLPVPPPPILHRGREGSPEISTSGQATASHPSPPGARAWPPTTITPAVGVLLPVPAPAEVQGTLEKPSLTTPVPPTLPRVPSGQASFSGSPLSRSWLQCWGPQNTETLPRPPAARSPATWLSKPWGSSLVAVSLAKPTQSPNAEWPPPATRFIRTPHHQ